MDDNYHYEFSHVTCRRIVDWNIMLPRMSFGHGFNVGQA